jgi:pyruvate/2-oxoglutarate dehydrogenase complex dihydrolipoamide acyltransferase (E2) component
MTPIIIEQTNVNDDTVIVVNILKKDLDKVKKNELLFEIESSKATIEIESPKSGILKIIKSIGDEIKVGKTIGFIFENETELQKFDIKKYDKNKYNKDKSEKTLSAKALKLATKMNIDINELKRKKILTEADIKLHYKTLSDNREDFDPNNKFSSEDFETLDVSKNKYSEIKNIFFSKQNYIPCVCSVMINNFKINKFSQKNNLYFNNILPLLAKIVSELLVDFKNLNGFYHLNKKNHYKKINIGFTIDIDNGLKVPVIKDCTSLTYENIKIEYFNLIKKYMENKISQNDLSKLTFTISDLSSVGDVYFHIPLLAVNTSANLGVAIDKSNNTLNLILAYDHQMSSGKEVLTFLIALKKKIIDLI